ncbi:MAG TPA: zf-HC2 domain-containing protein [Planctomycetaceae bacterium]|nr:zf-HC2 domain-containing protein [Planctomycetaceae bacterium]
MNCKRAQAQIALSVGGDLDDATERELQEHLAGCPGCKRHWTQMDHTWALLLDRDDELPDPHDSVWPDLQVRLPDRREFLSRARFNGWVVALAATGVCLAMVSLWKTANTSEPTLGPWAVSPDVLPPSVEPVWPLLPGRSLETLPVGRSGFPAVDPAWADGEREWPSTPLPAPPSREVTPATRFDVWGQ